MLHSKACLDMSLRGPSRRSPYKAPTLTHAASPERAETPVKEPSVSTAFFYPSLKVHGKGGPFRIPEGALMERSTCFQSLLLHIVQSPQYRSSPSRLPSQSNHRERRRSVYTAFFTCLSKYLVKEPTLQVPRRGPHEERCRFPEAMSLGVPSGGAPQIVTASQSPRQSSPPPNSPNGADYGDNGPFQSLLLHISLSREKKILVLGPKILASVPSSVQESSVIQTSPRTSVGAYGPRIHSALRC